MNDRHILVVEDDDSVRLVTQLSLETTAGWQVTAAPDGMNCLRLAAQLQPDAVLLDVMMPLMDGPETATRLRASPGTRHIPIVFLTASPRTRAEAWAEIGVAGFIAKPFDPLLLASRVAGILGWEAPAR